jgi:hypothetical protein
MAKKWTAFGKGSIGKLGPVYQTKIIGLNEVLRNLNEALMGVKGRTAKGLVLAAAHMRDQTEHVPPKTPEDLGNLVASWYVVSTEGVAPDAENRSGEFKGDRKRGIKVSELRAAHNAAIGAAKAGVDAVKKRGPAVIMGYSANYALFVHEMIYAHQDVKWTREGSGPRWFEIAYKNNRDKLIQIVRDNAKIP